MKPDLVAGARSIIDSSLPVDGETPRLKMIGDNDLVVEAMKTLVLLGVSHISASVEASNGDMLGEFLEGLTVNDDVFASALDDVRIVLMSLSIDRQPLKNALDRLHQKTHIFYKGFTKTPLGVAVLANGASNLNERVADDLAVTQIHFLIQPEPLSLDGLGDVFKHGANAILSREIWSVYAKKCRRRWSVAAISCSSQSKSSRRKRRLSRQ